MTDQGFLFLAGLRRLKCLRCSNLANVTTKGIARFFVARAAHGAVPIQRLDLAKSAVNDSVLGLIAWQGGKELETLSIARTQNCDDHNQITDTGFLILAAACPMIKHLDLSYCRRITGRSVEAIAEFSSLLSINLTGCRGIPVSHLGLMGELRRRFGRLRQAITDCDLKSLTSSLNSCLTIGDSPGLTDDLLAEITRNGALLGWSKSAVSEPVLRSQLGTGDSWD